MGYVGSRHCGSLISGVHVSVEAGTIETTGKLGNYGQLPLVRNCAVSQGIIHPQFASFIAQKYTTAPKLTATSLMLNSVPQLNLVRSIATSQRHCAPITGDHVRLWQAERVTSAILIGLLPACILLENPFVDVTLSVFMVMHSHWGLEAIVIDYARPIVVGNIVPKIAHFALNLFSAATLAGLLLLIYNGPGLGKTVKNLWTVGKSEAAK
ncbi:succinate dehydrogenase [ubiquinone] cytochrome b small subunit, mitochondrial isoform X1 [Neodiprion lecontei]|uniref:Succinate dehydrogenase [ubiquinone] cytochrome b small subunit n=1 Tax=Neodiprion lecontei TaxID=441921 RepID=A0ABM3FZ21_NEOLC|nr:succinate dehydrogenase [ubiquinone] cytochrome b small subunit, mitochondrial isoform X1 [Neodiprion lecontei]